jgi:hypothetical protein
VYQLTREGSPELVRLVHNQEIPSHRRQSGPDVFLSGKLPAQDDSDSGGPVFTPGCRVEHLSKLIPIYGQGWGARLSKHLDELCSQYPRNQKKHPRRCPFTQHPACENHQCEALSKPNITAQHDNPLACGIKDGFYEGNLVKH